MLQKTYITLLFLLVASSAFAQKTERDYLRSGNLSLRHICSGVATTANVAKETLADTVEYDITGTKTNYTLQEGESPVSYTHLKGQELPKSN